MNACNTTKTFLTCREAVRTTGLSYRYLLEGCKSGRIPHMMTGNRFMINMPLFRQQLDALSMPETDEE